MRTASDVSVMNKAFHTAPSTDQTHSMSMSAQPTTESELRVHTLPVLKTCFTQLNADLFLTDKWQVHAYFCIPFFLISYVHCELAWLARQLH